MSMLSDLADGGMDTTTWRGYGELVMVTVIALVCAVPVLVVGLVHRLLMYLPAMQRRRARKKAEARERVRATIDALIGAAVKRDDDMATVTREYGDDLTETVSSSMTEQDEVKAREMVETFYATVREVWPNAEMNVSIAVPSKA